MGEARGGKRVRNLVPGPHCHRGYWLLVTRDFPTPRRAKHDTPRPHKQGRWALVRLPLRNKFPSAEGCRDTGPRATRCVGGKLRGGKRIQEYTLASFLVIGA